MILVQKRFSNVSVKDTEICFTLENAMGAGGGNIPIILAEVQDVSVGEQPRSCNNKRHGDLSYP